ncbi:PD-(D/E)XK motif protein [Amycolatopsis thermoflava]|uniref:PD-(D/E)XK motif protein n=1 Tax=Amycolatopsis thermoflava TaxID=84480 RepID=UPI003F49FC55
MADTSEDWRRELKRTWPVLRPGPEGELAVYPVARRPAGDTLIAVDPRHDHHLLVPLPAGEHAASDDRSAHVRIRQTELTVDGKRRRYLDVVCHRHDLNPLFDDVLAAMLAALETSAGPVADTCRHVLDNWRELLRRAASPLSEEAERGLFAELVVLERILTADRLAHVRATWTGPDRTPHDFRLSAHDLEVKAVSSTAGFVEIHGLDQLDPGDRSLYLVLVFVRKNREGDGLSDLVRRVQAAGRDRQGFLEQLSKTGYIPREEDEPEVTRYRVDQICALTVSERFPRLTRGMLTVPLPQEVSSVRYTLELASLLPTALTGDELNALFERSDDR